jgi:hypothetical protein
MNENASYQATAQITELISEPDNIEIVRDQVAAILSLELQNQLAISQNDKDYNIPVYVENGRPYEMQDDKTIMRFINVLLPGINMSDEDRIIANPRTGNQKERATFYIDCAACGNDSGSFRDDKSAAIRVWKVTRLVRRILMSDYYTYLGMRGIVGSRVVKKMEAGTPEKPELERESALSYVVVRITFEVQFMERSIRASGEPLEIINYEIDPISGELTVS